MSGFQPSIWQITIDLWDTLPRCVRWTSNSKSYAYRVLQLCSSVHFSNLKSLHIRHLDVVKIVLAHLRVSFDFSWRWSNRDLDFTPPVFIIVTSHTSPFNQEPYTIRHVPVNHPSRPPLRSESSSSRLLPSLNLSAELPSKLIPHHLEISSLLHIKKNRRSLQNTFSNQTNSYHTYYLNKLFRYTINSTWTQNSTPPPPKHGISKPSPTLHLVHLKLKLCEIGKSQNILIPNPSPSKPQTYFSYHRS